MAIVRYGGMPSRYSPSVGKQIGDKWMNTLLYDVPKGIATAGLKLPLKGTKYEGLLGGGGGVNPSSMAAQALLQQQIGGMDAAALQGLFGALDEETLQKLRQSLGG
tara:strand:+ start:304 stop:621 length:318 start_codon:yes stop_codon:yes gene_type:complete